MSKYEYFYEKETGEKALYRKECSDYHTLKYVRWLEALVGEPCGHKNFSTDELECKICNDCGDVISMKRL